MDECIPYRAAEKMLIDRLGANPDEIAQWVFSGELPAYTNCKFEGVKPFIFRPIDFRGNDDYIEAVRCLWFKLAEIENYDTNNRFISRLALIQRWGENCGNKIDALKLINKYTLDKNNVRLTEYHPISGAVEAKGDKFRNGVFDLKDVESCEEIEWGYPPDNHDLLSEIVSNGEPINWGYWVGLSNITPEQAAKLAHCIDPISWPGNEYAQGVIPKILLEKVNRLIQWLECRSQNWSLADLVGALGKNNAPFGIIKAVNAKADQNVSSKPTLNEHGRYTLEQATRVDDARRVTESGNQRNERELKQGLREIWVKEGRPEMKAFFPDKLKKYINQSGSPITAVYTAGKDAGFTFKLSTGTTGNRTKKTLSNYVSEFKKTP